MTGRQALRFRAADGDDIAAWVYLPDGIADTGDGSVRCPAVILGHGLGGTRDMGMPAFAERFRADGYLCVVFDYRHFGDSGGEPRQLLDVRRQLADWASAIVFARSLPVCDPDRIVLWGSSFGGGHVLRAGARDGRVAAVVAQCPFTHGPSSALRLDPVAAVRVGVRAVADVVGSVFGRPPVTVSLAGHRGSAAMMTSADALAGYESQLTDGTTFRNRIAARFALQIVRYAPGRSIRRLRCPVLLCVCAGDAVAPPGPTRRYAAQAQDGEVREYPYGHFDIYTGAPFEAVVTDQLDFLRRRVPVARREVDAADPER